MIASRKVRADANARVAPRAFKALAVTTVLLSLTACRPGEESGGAHVAGWTLLDASQRHPIVVSQQPANINLRVARGASGLNPHQRSQLVTFLNKYRGGDTGNGKITVNVPSGSPNEVAAMHAATDVRDILREYNIDDTRIQVAPYHTDGEPQPPIRIYYARFVAEGPSCGQWPTNLASDSRNLPHPNLGCATQRNFAAQVANPTDLLGPRTMTPAIAERRDVQWEKFTKGESTITKKDQDERVQVKGAN
jgi:pilus assembly protein CpaD